MCHSIGAVAEETDTDALPITASHGEAVACCYEAFAICAIIELMAVLLTVVGDLEIETREGTRLDELTMAILLDENAVFAEADACEQLARAEETRIAVS